MAIIISPVNNPITNTLYFQATQEKQPFVDEDFYILAEDVDLILDEDGSDLIQEIAP